jgi:CheY-like chemotaxis protein
MRSETAVKPGRGHAGHMRVLVVDDAAELAETVAVGLRRERMAVDVAVDGPSGLDRALETDDDVRRCCVD